MWRCRSEICTPKEHLSQMTDTARRQGVELQIHLKPDLLASDDNTNHETRWNEILAISKHNRHDDNCSKLDDRISDEPWRFRLSLARFQQDFGLSVYFAALSAPIRETPKAFLTISDDSQTAANHVYDPPSTTTRKRLAAISDFWGLCYGFESLQPPAEYMTTVV